MVETGVRENKPCEEKEYKFTSHQDNEYFCNSKVSGQLKPICGCF